MAIVSVPTGTEVAAFLGRGGETELVTLAGIHVGIVTELAKAYTRGKGFEIDDDGDVTGIVPEIRSVLIMATARTVMNPEQAKREEFGDYQITHGTLYGWTLVEITTLNRYRKTAR